MMKRFRKWRDNLNLSKAKKIMWIVSIIIVITLGITITQNREQIAKNLEEGVPFELFVILSLVLSLLIANLGIYLVLNVDEKKKEEKGNNNK